MECELTCAIAAPGLDTTTAKKMARTVASYNEQDG